jgi:hypothetical protein
VFQRILHRAQTCLFADSKYIFSHGRCASWYSETAVNIRTWRNSRKVGWYFNYTNFPKLSFLLLAHVSHTKTRFYSIDRFKKLLSLFFLPKLKKYVNQSNHCRLIEYFKTNSFTKYKYNTMYSLSVKNTDVYANLASKPDCATSFPDSSFYAPQERRLWEIKCQVPPQIFWNLGLSHLIFLHIEYPWVF